MLPRFLYNTMPVTNAEDLSDSVLGERQRHTQTGEFIWVFRKILTQTAVSCRRIRVRPCCLYSSNPKSSLQWTWPTWLVSYKCGFSITHTHTHTCKNTKTYTPNRQRSFPFWQQHHGLRLFFFFKGMTPSSSSVPQYGPFKLIRSTDVLLFRNNQSITVKRKAKNKQTKKNQPLKITKTYYSTHL